MDQQTFLWIFFVASLVAIAIWQRWRRQAVERQLETVIKLNREEKERLLKEIDDLHHELGQALLRTRVAEQKAEAAQYDPTTGLLSRVGLKPRFEQMFESVARREHILAVLCVDLDGFKAINDTHGHPVGDKVLKEVGMRMLSVVRKADIVARLGGDEYLIVLVNGEDVGGIGLVVDRLFAEMEQSIEIGLDVKVQVGMSIGIALYPLHAQSIEELLHTADDALLQAKRQGKNQACYAQSWPTY